MSVPWYCVSTDTPSVQIPPPNKRNGTTEGASSREGELDASEASSSSLLEHGVAQV